jgi:hypothetical protein
MLVFERRQQAIAHTVGRGMIRLSLGSSVGTETDYLDWGLGRTELEPP